VPLYDFECGRCGERFETYAAESARPTCPACGTPDARRLLSPFAGPFTTALRGAAARRSDSTRRVREEQRREKSLKRRAEREER
jgi:putative FmdB family regulatory protein